MKSFSYNNNNGSDENQKTLVAACLWSTYADLQAAIRVQDTETCMSLIDQLDKLIDNVLKDSNSLTIDKFVKEFERGIVEPCKSELYIIRD